MRRFLQTAGALLATLLLWTAPAAQGQSYPAKPIRWVVGYPAGGGTDFLARSVAAQMSQQIGQQVLVDNRPGAGAIIASEHVARSPADGYTLFSADNGVLVYNPALYKKLPYDPAKDFSFIGLMARSPLIIAAAPNAGIKDAKALLEELKRNPGKWSYASPGAGSPHHLAMELVKSAAHLFVLHIPYKGGAPALQDLMGGQVPLMMLDLPTGIGAVKAGKVVPLIALSGQRIAQLPEVPTMKELGYPSVEAYAWQGMVVPAGTPKDVQAKLASSMQQALSTEAVKKKLYEAAWDPVPSDGNQMQAYAASETRLWHQLIKDRGISLD